MVKRHALNHAIMIILSIVIISMLCSNTSFAATCGGVETALISCEEGGDGGIYHLLILIIDIFTIGVGILGVSGIIWAGIQYLTAREDIAKTTKAKTRIYEIVLGLAAYAVLWGITQWLLPGGKLNYKADNTNVSQISISYNGQAMEGKTFKPTVSFNEEATDKTYSLVSSDKSTIATLGMNAKCVSTGTSTITAIAANGKKSSIDISCQKNTDAGSSSDDGDDDDDDNSGNNQSDTISTVGSQADTEMKHEKPQARKETRAIISEHESDFFHVGDKSYKKVVLGKNSKYGNYKNYVKSLGGIFEKFADNNRIKVTTAADLQAAAEYVFGLWSIWGPDYSGWFMVKWKGKDAFYQNDPKRSSYAYTKTHSINKVLSSSNDKTIDTHCNKSMHVFMASTTLKSINTGAGKSKIKKKLGEKGYYSDKLIKKISDLKVGDLVNFESCKPPAGHVALVGEVYKDYLVFYDGGSRFMKKNNYKFKVKRNAKNFSGTTYSSYCNWYGYRPWKIDQSITLGGLN